MEKIELLLGVLSVNFLKSTNISKVKNAVVDAA